MMAIQLQNVTKKYNGTIALQDINLELEAGKIYGLLGRNGAGKTTLLSLLSALRFPTSGSIRIFGQDPVEKEDILSQVVLIREQGQFPEDFKVDTIVKTAGAFYPHFDMDYALSLMDTFGLEPKRRFKKLSRGMQSAVGIVVGLAARAEITLLDEPSLGLDVVARQQFYDLLLEDYTEHPRTIIFSTHLIDEVSKLFESVIFLDQGRITRVEDAEDLRSHAVTLSGKKEDVAPWLAGREVLHQEVFGNTLVATLYDSLTPEDRRAMEQANIDLSGVPLQKLFIYLSKKALTAAGGPAKDEEVKEL